MIGHLIGAVVCAAVGTYLINVAAKNQSLNDALAGLCFFLIGYVLVVQIHG